MPSGLKWANMNIGAEKETDYGLYFQWGDTIGYTDASHSTADTYPGGGTPIRSQRGMLKTYLIEY